MKKKDLIIISVTCLIVLLIALFTWLFYINNKKGNGKIVVEYDNKVILEVAITDDGLYKLQGDYGILYLEVLDQKWRITQEDCPNHDCSRMGWVGPAYAFPIVCLPNKVIVNYCEDYNE